MLAAVWIVLELGETRAFGKELYSDILNNSEGRCFPFIFTRAIRNKKILCWDLSYAASINYCLVYMKKLNLFF